MSNNVKVVVKLRPRSDKEIAAGLRERWTIVGNTIRCPSKSFQFDYLFSSSSTNTDVFVGVVESMVDSCKNGFNSTVFTYGEKASGKTYTMDGTDEDPGIKILAIEHLFKGNQSETNSRKFVIRVGYVEIYNESIYDLLNRRQNVHFDNNFKQMSNTEVIVNDRQTLCKLLQKGNNAKTPVTGDKRAISHTIFRIIIESQNGENGPFQVSHLNLVDLDRSDGAHIKDESGGCADKSMECFGKAIVALGKDEKFRQYSESKLTRMLKTALCGKANVAIICNINPTVLNQTTQTLNFAEQAQRGKIWPQRYEASDVLMQKVRDELMKVAALPPSDSVKLDAELADLESIVLMGNNMRPKCNSAARLYAMNVLKVRPFFLDGSSGRAKKYQIGEMDSKRVDSQSSSTKMHGLQMVRYYLERVGFEINVKMRRTLKYGKNLVGRSDVNDDINICIDSRECSRKHCIINVANDQTVSLTDLNSSNGTTINGVINKGQTVKLREGDVIAIVNKGQNLLSFFIGNFDCTVYRLRNLARDTIQTYDLNDNDDLNVVVLSDDDDADQDGSSCQPMEMEVDLPQPSVFVEVQTSTQESTVVECVENTASSSGILSLDGELRSSCELVNDSASDYLDELFGLDLADMETSKLGKVAGELDILAMLQTENDRLTEKLERMNRDYESDRKLFAEEREVAALKMAEVAAENSKLTADAKWLELKLAAITQEKNDLLSEISKLRAVRTGYYIEKY